MNSKLKLIPILFFSVLLMGGCTTYHELGFELTPSLNENLNVKLDYLDQEKIFSLVSSFAKSQSCVKSEQIDPNYLYFHSCMGGSRGGAYIIECSGNKKIIRIRLLHAPSAFESRVFKEAKTQITNEIRKNFGSNSIKIIKAPEKWGHPLAAP